MTEFIQVKELIEKLNLAKISGSLSALENQITNSEVTRPGLELTGYLDHFTHDRVLIFGRKEISFLETMDIETRKKRLEGVFSKQPPVIVISHNLTCVNEIIFVAEKFDLPVLRSTIRTSRLIGIISSFLADGLSPRISIHGVLMDVYGVGILIKGDWRWEK